MIPRRDFFDGPVRLQQVWTLTKDRRAAVCEVWSHELGYELRLLISGDDLPRTQVYRTVEEFATYQESWRQALEAQGWRKAAGAAP
jgi:hypothetical protein